MRTFERGDVIKVPFPYTDRATRQSRPAVVIATAQLQELHGLLWVVMITSAENRGWPDDVPVANLKLAGLPVPSLIRSAKIATIDGSRARSDRGWGPRKRCTLGTGQNQIPPHVYGAVEPSGKPASRSLRQVDDVHADAERVHEYGRDVDAIVEGANRVAMSAGV